MPELVAELPEKLEPLFAPHRYKVIYGGRSSTKSWSVARALLLLGFEKPMRILCAREIQKSIDESVHELLKQQIQALGLDYFYSVKNTSIDGANGTSFTFAGLRSNIRSIKSMEGLDIVWVEEANGVSANSWDTLIPTVRKDGSEIWVTFNPELEEDETYQRFVVKTPPGAVAIEMNYTDNPWFNDVLEAERVYKREHDPDGYQNIWLGKPRVALEGAIYADELRAATEAGRITKVPYVLGSPVHTFWDLGRSDYTSIWFAQIVGFQKRVIDYYQSNRKHISHYLQELQSKRYVYGRHYLPHDARAETLGAEQSIEAQVKAAYPGNVVVVQRMAIAQGINLARTVFPECWFDQEKCADGLQCLRHYRYAVDPETNRTSKEPLHDDYSNGADAFRYLAVGLKAPQERPKVAPRQAVAGWMR